LRLHHPSNQKACATITYQSFRAKGPKTAPSRVGLLQYPFLIFRTEAKNAAAGLRLCYVFYKNNPPLLQDQSEPGSHQVIARHDF
jgi:hypothetical protein